ncbi:hypothetical protein P775_23295 [Puniceibacterium antarcticum]|uniref:Uncharacterized protein n=1 Tax=Puniceibacterium antarcticum TaxID=1206336 RepID=A0A2G8R8E4_9RHOB|nr:hypothetical protein [Puniceibacterium antarcticum]PIL17773.1 hypothetical protein P775_23295 [Puniceibacterium antarcticum]
MEFIVNVLTSDAMQTTILAILGPLLMFVLNRIAGALQASTGVKLSERAVATFHSSIISGVESGLAHGLEAGTATFKAHVKAHMLESSPEAFAKMSPLPDVLDNLIYRYARQSIVMYGEPK